MFNIQKYLEKFSKNINSTELHKKQILDIIEKFTQTRIALEDIEIKDCVIAFKGSPALKNKVFIYKEKILNEITKNTPVKIIDIR